MAKRKNIPQKLRYEVFKRDSFKCQYCGRSAPDVVLEVDHIKPVADGGGNEIMNLITSCFDCNRGKGKRRLDDNTEVVKQKAELELLNRRREQMEMMLRWRKELESFEQDMSEVATERVLKVSGYECNENGKAKITKLIKQFGLEEVLEAIDLSFDKYYFKGDVKSWEYAFGKIGGICYNRKKNRETNENSANMVFSDSAKKFAKIYLGIELEDGLNFTDLYNAIIDFVNAENKKMGIRRGE